MPPAPLLGQASIIIDQATLSPGTAGRARNDGVLGELVTLRNADNTNVVKHRWVLATPRGSATTLSAPNSASCQFEPDHDGTYVVTLYVNEGTGRLQKAVSLFAIRSTTGYRYPGQGEGAQANWPSTYTGVANETGWWEDIIEALRGATVVKTGVEALLDVVDEAENLVAVRANGPAVHDDAKYGQVNLGTDGKTGNNYATVLGGSGNTASGEWSTVVAGKDNTSGGAYAFIGGGVNHEATGNNAVIGGGATNTAIDYGVVGGGSDNNAGGDHSVVGGGATNTVSGAFAGVFCGTENLVFGNASVIAGGSQNEVDGDYAAVIGGIACQSTGDYSITGGRGAIATANYGIALNRAASVVHEGAVIIKDGNVNPVVSSQTQELSLGFHGGVRILVPGSRTRISAYDHEENYLDILQGDVTTTNGTAQVVPLITIPTGQEVTLRGWLKGKRAATNACRCHYFEGTYYNVGGTVTLLGAALKDTTVQADGLAAAYASALAIKGTSIDLNFTGTIGHTVAWVWSFFAVMGGV